MKFTVSVNLATNVVTWTTYDQNGNAIVSNTAATLAAAATAAIASLKAFMSSQASALTTLQGSV